MRLFTFFLLCFFLFSKLTLAQTTLSDIQEKIAQKLTWEAKKDMDEMMTVALSDTLVPRAALYFTKGIVYDALVRESTISQDIFLEETLAAYKEALFLSPQDTAQESVCFQADIRMKALFAFLYNNAVNALAKNDNEKAIFFYKAALRLQPTNVKLLKKLLLISWETKTYNLSKNTLYELFRREQFDADYFKMLLFIEAETEKDYEKALKICAEAQHHHPTDSTFFFAKVNYLAKTGDYFAALDLLEPLSEENNPQVLDNLAFLHRKIGRLRDAEKYWNKVYELNKQNLLPIYNIGEMFFNQGINYLKQTPKYMITQVPNPYFEAAKPYLQKFYEKNPKNEQIKEAYKIAKSGTKSTLKRNKKKEVVILPSPPTILITQPGFETDTFYTENAAEIIEGLLIDEDGGAEVVINGIVGTVENDRFSVLVPLRRGINEINISGINYEGLTAEKKFFIIRRDKKQEIHNYLLIFGSDFYQKQDSLLGHEARLLALDSIFNQSFENFGKLNTWRLIGKDAVKEKLIAAIRDISRNIKTNDNLIFIFSGKTNDFSPNHDTYLQTYSSESDGNDLPASFVIELFKTVAARNQLFIFDCKLNKIFVEKAERSKFENVDFFTSRRIISEKKGAASGSLLGGLRKLFEEDSMHSFYGYDLFFQLNLQQKNFCEYLYLLGDKAEGGDLLLKKKRK